MKNTSFTGGSLNIFKHKAKQVPVAYDWIFLLTLGHTSVAEFWIIIMFEDETLN